MELKVCCKCKIEPRNGRQAYCKGCCKIYQKQHRIKNKDRYKENQKKWELANKEKVRKKVRRYYISHYEERRDYRKKRYEKPEIAQDHRERARLWRQNNPEKYQAQRARMKPTEESRKKAREYLRERRKKDILFKIVSTLRKRMWGAISRGYKKTNTKELVGCDISFLKTYLENMFLDGMTWENHGQKTWHIDHIIPCSAFDLTKEEEQKKCFHYTNLQPLFATDNLKKGNKIIYNQNQYNPQPNEHQKT